MALVTRYVNTASTAGGDGTTNGTAGATRAYATMAEWTGAENTSLIAATDTHIVYCSGTSADTTSVDIKTGWLTNASYFVTISGNLTSGDGYNDTGIWSTSYYRLDVSTGGGDTLVSTLPSTVIEKIQMRCAVLGKSVIANAAAGTNNIYRDLLIRAEGGSSAKSVKVRGGGIVENCIVDGRGTVSQGLRAETNGSTMYNNTVTGCTPGIDGNGKVTTLKNNVVFNNTDDFANISAATLDYNASDDADGTNAQTLSVTRADDFTDVTTFDYSPVSSGVLPSNGLGSDTDAVVPLADIKDVTRSTSAPSIGAIEYGAVSSFVPKMGIY